MQATVNPDHGFPFNGKRACLLIGQAFGQRQTTRDVFVMIELLLILRRSDNRHVHRAAFGGVADFHQLHAVRLLGEFLPVVNHLRIIDEEIIVTDVMPKLFHRTGDFGLSQRRCG